MPDFYDIIAMEQSERGHYYPSGPSKSAKTLFMAQGAAMALLEQYPAAHYAQIYRNGKKERRVTR